jgi:hypothetical protein
LSNKQSLAHPDNGRAPAPPSGLNSPCADVQTFKGLLGSELRQLSSQSGFQSMARFSLGEQVCLLFSFMAFRTVIICKIKLDGKSGISPQEKWLRSGRGEQIWMFQFM